MMGLWLSLTGMLQIEMKCADPSYALTQMQQRGITLNSVQYVDEFTVSFSVSRMQIHAVRALAQKRGFELRLADRNGLYWMLIGLLQRPVLLLGLAGLFFLGIFLPTRVLFIQVEGNRAVPSRLIIEAAADCGITFGASRREVRSERMKNALLEKLPQLQWAGINTSGCTAVISVKERQLQQNPQPLLGVASIVACRDGMITTVTTTRGNPLCKPGQAVKAGQTLISGYTDCGLTIQAVRAEGEIYAETERNLTVITPVQYAQRQQIGSAERKYALIIGKKRINLYFGSGISCVSCVKMYTESYLTLPGGFQLPLAIATETQINGQCDAASTPVITESHLLAAAQRYLTDQMVAGQILHADTSFLEEDGLIVVYGRYACLEMIGQIREEEIVKPNGTNH